MEVKATLEEKTSKSGNKYQVIVIKLTDTLDKIVFLDKAELEILKMKQAENDFPSYLNN